jgi:hypothetical protein
MRINNKRSPRPLWNTKQVLKPRWSWLFILGLLTVLGFLSYLAVLSDRASDAIDKFRASTNEGRLIGKTPAEVEKLLGRPSFDSRFDGGTGANHYDTDDAFKMIYEGPVGDVCGIDFNHGVVAHVGYGGK